MRPRGPLLAERLPPLLTGLGVPFLSAMAFVFFKEAGSTLVRSDASLTKAQQILLAGRIEAVCRWAAPALIALLTAWTAYGVRAGGEGEGRPRLPVWTALGSCASFLVLGLAFQFSFSFWQGGIGLWYSLSLPLVFATGTAGGALGRRGRERRSRLSRILSGSDGGRDGVRDAIGEYARFASVPAVHAVLDGSPFFLSDRRMERHRTILGKAGNRIASLPPGKAAVRRLPAAVRGLLAPCGVRSVAFLPLAGAEKAPPSFVVLFFTRPAFLLRGEWQFRLLSAQLALRMENARLLEKARSSAVLEERQRLAREIHDTIAQDLIGIVVNLEALERQDGREPDRRAQGIRDAVRTARQALQETRNLVWALRPLALEENPLPVALSRSLREWSRRSGTEAEFQVEGEPYRLMPDAEITLFRMLQEACSNVARHAKAGSVKVRLRFVPEEAVLSVRDDGIGMPEGRDGEDGFGLPAMRQRIEALGGVLEVSNAAGAGTELRATIPRAAASIPEGKDVEDSGPDRR